MALTYRGQLDRPLTSAEIDANFSYFTGSHSITGSITISGSIVPTVGTGELTSSFSLGSETAAWKDIYVSNGSIKFIQSGSQAVTLSSKDGGIQVNDGAVISDTGINGQFYTSKSLNSDITVKDSNNSLLMGPIDVEIGKEIVVEEDSDLTIFGDIEIQYVDNATYASNANSASYTDSASYANSASYTNSSSYAATSSYTNSSSYAATSSYTNSASNATSASYSSTAVSASNADSASYAVSASYIDTASYAYTSSYLTSGDTQIYDDGTNTIINGYRIAITSTTGSIGLTAASSINFNSPSSFGSQLRVLESASSNLGGAFVVDPISSPPTHSAANGQILPMYSGSSYYLYVRLNGIWKSASLF
jgi:hypothetical protein